MNSNEISVICKKGQGIALGQLLRQLAYSSIVCWRPIAFSIDRKVTSILHSEGDVVQDMVEFSQNLASLQFVGDENSTNDLEIQEYKFNGTLTSNALANGGKIKCITPDVTVLSVLNNAEASVTIYFRRAYGVQTINQNASFLAERDFVGRDIKVISSTHTILSSFVSEVTEHSLDEDRLTIKMTSKSRDCKEILKESIQLAVESLNTLYKQLGD